MYALVEFKGPNPTIAVAHKSWIIGGKCYWPPWKDTFKLNNALRKGTIPDPTKWIPYEVHVVGGIFFNTYEEARGKLSLPQHKLDASDLSSVDETATRKRRPVQRKSSSDSKSSKISKKIKKRQDPPLPLPPVLPSYQGPSPTHPTLVAVASLDNDRNLESGHPASVVTHVLSDSPFSNQHHLSTAGMNSDVMTESQNIPVQDGGVTRSVNSHLYRAETPGIPMQRNVVANSVFDTSMQNNYTAVSNDNTHFSNFAYSQSSSICLMSRSGPGGTSQPFALHTIQPMAHCGFPNSSSAVDHGVNQELKGIQIQLGVVTSKLDIALDMLGTIMRGPSIRNHVEDASIFSNNNFPLLTLDQFTDLDTQIKEKNARTALVDVLATRGGDNASQIKYRIMVYLLTDELQCEFSIAGKKNKAGIAKRCFRNTRVFNAICDGVKKQPKGSVASDKDVDKAVEYWLKRAPLRLKNAMRAIPTEIVDDTST